MGDKINLGNHINYIFVVYITPSNSADDIELSLDTTILFPYIYNHSDLIACDINLTNFTSNQIDRNSVLSQNFLVVLNKRQLYNILNNNSGLLDLVVFDNDVTGTRDRLL